MQRKTDEQVKLSKEGDIHILKAENLAIGKHYRSAFKEMKLALEDKVKSLDDTMTASGLIRQANQHMALGSIRVDNYNRLTKQYLMLRLGTSLWGPSMAAYAEHSEAMRSYHCAVEHIQKKISNFGKTDQDCRSLSNCYSVLGDLSAAHDQYGNAKTYYNNALIYGVSSDVEQMKKINKSLQKVLRDEFQKDNGCILTVNKYGLFGTTPHTEIVEHDHIRRIKLRRGVI